MGVCGRQAADEACPLPAAGALGPEPAAVGVDRTTPPIVAANGCPAEQRSGQAARRLGVGEISVDDAARLIAELSLDSPICAGGAPG